MDTKTVEQEKQLVVFDLYNEEFGLEITQVREIIKLPSITKLPHVSDYVKGVTNIRGEIIPIISLRKRFSITEEENTSETRVIIVDISDNQVGFIVDAVTEVMRIPASAIEPPPTNIAGLNKNYLKGVAKVEQRLIILLEVNKILTSSEQIKLDKIKDWSQELTAT